MAIKEIAKKATTTTNKKATVAAKKEELKEITKVLTPMGRFSYPYLAKPDEGRKYSTNQYQTDFFIKKEDFKTDKALMNMVLKVGRAYFNDDSLTLADFKNPFKDMDKVEDCAEHEKGCVMIRPKSKYPPVVFGPDKSVLPQKDVEAIKGGDYGRLIVTVFGYEQQGGGVTLALNAVQFAMPGEALGKGILAYINMIEEIEVEDPEMPSTEEEADSTNDDDADMNF